MKKTIAFVLCLCISFGLVACGEPAGSAQTPGTSTATTDLYAAVEKMADTDSFRITIERNDGIKPETDIYQISRSDGELRMLCVLKQYANARTPVESNIYYEGNARYSIDSMDDYIQRKTIYEDGLPPLVELIRGNLTGDANAFFDAFLAMQPKCQTKNGMTVFSKSLSKEEYISLAHKVFNYVYEDYLVLGKATVSVTVDSEGYLREMDLNAGLISEGPSITFTIDQINEIDSLERPDFAENFVSNIGVRKEPLEDSMDSEVNIVKDGVGALYSNTPFDLTTRGGWTMQGFTGEDGSSVSVYEIPEQIDGFPVLSAYFGSYLWDDITVERAVIPKGVQVYGGTLDFEEGIVKETVLFFCDEESWVIKSFGTVDEPHFEEGAYKAAYYAGEWEYVDGIPTPIK